MTEGEIIARIAKVIGAHAGCWEETALVRDPDDRISFSCGVIVFDDGSGTEMERHVAAVVMEELREIDAEVRREKITKEAEKKAADAAKRRADAYAAGEARRRKMEVEAEAEAETRRRRVLPPMPKPSSDHRRWEAPWKRAAATLEEANKEANRVIEEYMKRVKANEVELRRRGLT